MCGADSGNNWCTAGVGGSPPRVRSRPSGPGPNIGSVRITSACAEQTSTPSPRPRSTGDHLRVCGADGRRVMTGDVVAGSPPRVRSRLGVRISRDGHHGITSACAEQTDSTASSDGADWDHLRVCGADTPALTSAITRPGSPPRVRSRLQPDVRQRMGRGITSACAEQTAGGGHRGRPERDHLRVCGADIWLSSPLTRATGSPPRVRSRLRVTDCDDVIPGITSACAEQTPVISSVWCPRRDHLRVCGADARRPIARPWQGGSPPRVRSRRKRFIPCCVYRRITSACAEQTLYSSGR